MTEALGWTAMILLTTCGLPQFVKMYRTRSVRDISPWMWWMFLVGHLFALAYAYLIWQPPLLAKYTLNILIAVVILVAYYSYRRFRCTAGEAK